MAQELTIDELARQGGVPTSTVRLYQSRGLLPPPRLVGRVGWYGPDHLARLRLIARLQERGFSLAGIRQLVDAWQGGRTIEEVLGLDPGAEPERTVRLTPGQLAERLGGREPTPELVRRSVELGLLSSEPGGTFRCDRRFLAFGEELAPLGI